VRFGDYRIILDPYKDGSVPGIKLAMQTANDVFCSHNHSDHGYTEAVSCIPTEISEPFSLEIIEAAHDDVGGAKRGKNLIHVFSYDDLRLAHFGDLGAPLTEAQLKALGHVDVIMVPVGGHYTITGKQACELAQQVGAGVVIPMHYRSAEFGFPVLDTLDTFLACAKEVKFYEGNQMEVSLETPSQVAVLKYLEETIPEQEDIELI
jgi:L-ascorbate metabolism protein UlaG (beta-lactamase superfamily)